MFAVVCIHRDSILLTDHYDMQLIFLWSCCVVRIVMYDFRHLTATSTIFYNLFRLFLEVDKETTASFTTWFHAAAHAGLDNLGAYSAVDLAHSQDWCDVPDVVECNWSEFTTPFGSDADTVEEGHEFVAKSEPAVKAGVWKLPDAVNTAGSLGFGQDIFELNLKCLNIIMLIELNIKHIYWLYTYAHAFLQDQVPGI